MRSILRFDVAARWLCLLALAAYAQTSSAQVITNLTVNNSTAVGGTGMAYQICPGGGSCGSTSGMVTNALQYVDRTFTITSAVPSNISGATFIMTANTDKNTSPGSSSYMSFTVTQAATVYIAHCTAVTSKPTWLTANFTDTGTSITNSNGFTFELYSANFAGGSTVTLGSNVVTGGNTSQAMYTVIVVPTASQTLISNLVVNNPTSSGGTGTAYQVCPGGSACGTTTGFVNGALQFLDRTFHINTAVPASLTGQTFIMTANSDKSANSGATNFVSFTVGQAVTVYVAHCTSITTKPSWLTSNFTNTGQVVSNDNGFSFGLYSRSYASGSTVTLGSNLPAGGTTSASMYTVIVVPTATSTLVSNVVNNGGTHTYVVCGTGGGTCGSTTGFVSGAPQYVDSTFTLAGTIPANVNGRTFIQTAEADKSAGAGTSNFLSFTLGQSATVFVAHDVRIALPTWLRSQFLDTGVSVKNNNGTPGSTLEIYSNLYPSGAGVQLGGNTQSGTTTADMYSVVVAPTAANTTAPNAPGNLALISGCNTAAVVGFTWTASTVNSGGLSVAGYRITRGGTIIATVPFTQTSYQDTSVLQSTAYTYTVTAFDQAGNTSPASTLSTTTTVKSATGDAQYCHSTKITAMTVNFLDEKSETSGNGSTNATNGATPTNFGGFDMPPYTDGSDLWSATQAADGNTYVFFGDGWGLCGREDTGSTMANDQTSFGFGKMTGLPSTGHCPPEWSNVYGGANSSKPNGGWTGSNLTSNGGLILGKVSNVLAIGNDFYGFGAAWRSGDSSSYLNGGHGPPKSGPNNHLEVLSSTGTGNNGSAWVDSTADLCNGSGTAAAPVWGGGLTVCPAQPIQFGPGYTGVPSSLAGFVYIYAVTPQSYLGDDASDGTYLVRVPTTQVTTPSAYQYFAGLDSSGNPIWSSNGNQKQVIFKDLIDTKYTYTSADGTACAGQRVSMEIGLRDAVYDAPLGRYIANAQGRAGQVAFYEAPNPWGPWSNIAYTNLSMSNIYNSGWGMPPPGGLGGGFCTTSNGVSSYQNSSGLGVHIMNGFTDATGKNIVMTFSSNGLAPPSASDLGGANANPNGNGNEMDSLNMFHAVLTSN
ncbi:MAG: hypothetical protein ACJ8R9_33990 [Steroidobacteraceae bacterium]